MAVLQAGNLSTTFLVPLECRIDRLYHAVVILHEE